MVLIRDLLKEEHLYTLHLPGNGKEILGNLLNNAPAVKIDNQVTLITVATEDVKDKCPLIKQLEDSNISYINAAKYQPIDKKWEHKDKLNLIVQALEEVKTPYVFIMDANDAIILNDIDSEFIEKWKSFDCDFLYNASDMLFPNLFCTDMEVGIPFSQHYINAGVGFGFTDYAKEIYQTAYEESQQDNYYPFDSEQYYVRISWLTHLKIKIDYRSKLFLLSHGN